MCHIADGSTGQVIAFFGQPPFHISLGVNSYFIKMASGGGNTYVAGAASQKILSLSSSFSDDSDSDTEVYFVYWKQK